MIFTLGIILIGQNFRGQTLATVSAGFAMAYSVGAIAGPASIGSLFDMLGPESLPVSIAIAFLGLSIYLFLSDSWNQQDDERAASLSLPNLTYLEYSNFEDDEPSNSPEHHAGTQLPPSLFPSSEVEAFEPQQGTTAPSNPPGPSRGHLRHEIDLTESFRQRAAMIAEKSVKGQERK